MMVDLEKSLVFSQVIQSSLRSDVVLWSEQAKKVILIELTVPWEEGCKEALKEKESTKTYCKNVVEKDGRHSCSWLRMSAGDSLHSHCGEY